MAAWLINSPKVETANLHQFRNRSIKRGVMSQGGIFHNNRNEAQVHATTQTNPENIVPSGASPVSLRMRRQKVPEQVSLGEELLGGRLRFSCGF